MHNLEPALQPNTRMIFIEPPANPTLKITDIQRTATVAHRHGVLVAVDNTFPSTDNSTV
jgi:cystathionine beta-lyase